MLAAVHQALVEGLNARQSVSEQMSEEMSEQMSEEMSEQNVMLTEAERSVLALLTERPELTADALSSALRVSPRTIERYLHSLQQKNRLERIGAKKGGFWRVK